jgi:translocation and assembly module TamA
VDIGLNASRPVLVLVLALAFAGAVQAAERKAQVQGLDDNHTLRDEIERAIGEVKTAPESRIEARRRARDAADSAEALLRSEGYYDASVEADIGDGDKPTPIVRISELGPRTLIARTDISWSGTVPDEASQNAAFDALRLKVGQAGRAADVLAAEGRIVAALESRGYADARAATRKVVVDHDDHTMAPTFDIAAGALVRLDGIKLTGASKTSQAFVDRLIPWKQGEVYRPEAVAQLERRLSDTGVYDSVTVALAPPGAPDQLRPVVVGLADRAKHTLDFIAGYSTSEGPDFDVKWSDYNRFHRADTLTYEARLAQIDSRAGVEWSIPHWLKPGQTLKTDLYQFRTVAPAYTEQGQLVGGDITRRFTTTSYLTAGLSLTQSEVNNKETGKIHITTTRLVGAFAWDHSDNPLDPHRGWKAQARVTPTDILGQEQLSFVKAEVKGSAYLPIGSINDVLAGQVHVGSIIGGTIPLVPASDRFFAGGGGSVRGYAYQSIGPHYRDNTPVGGLSLTEATVEYRHRFGASPFGGVVFVDAGSVGAYTTPSFSDVLVSVGVGLRYSLGFAPIRLDVATPLRKAGATGQSAFQMYLSIGQSF